MNCPMCGKEMISGIVQSNREILWIEENKKPQRITSKLFVHSKANAERCADCEIVVIKEVK